MDSLYNELVMVLQLLTFEPCMVGLLLNVFLDYKVF